MKNITNTILVLSGLGSAYVGLNGTRNINEEAREMLNNHPEIIQKADSIKSVSDEGSKLFRDSGTADIYTGTKISAIEKYSNDEEFRNRYDSLVNEWEYHTRDSEAVKYIQDKQNNERNKTYYGFFMGVGIMAFILGVKDIISNKIRRKK